MKNLMSSLSIMALAISLSACGGSGSSKDMTGNNNNSGSTTSGSGSMNIGSGSNNGYRINKVVLDANHTNKDGKDRIQSFVLSIGDQNYTVYSDKGLAIDLAQFPNGLNQLPLKMSGTANDGTVISGEGFAKVYQQRYSAIMGTTAERWYENGKLEIESLDGFGVTSIGGTPTPASEIPTLGSAVYQGKAFNRNSTGNLDYTINFADKSGKGSVTGLDTGTIVLERGKLSAFTALDDEFQNSVLVTDKNAQMMMGGKARYADGESGVYGIGLFGPHAEEIAGVVSDVDGEFNIGVGGHKIK